MNIEHARRESLKSVAGYTSTFSMKQMDSSYDSTDERECESCKYDLHLSAVGCECCPERFACLLHGHLLCSCPWSKKTLFYRYPLEQLSLLLAAVEGRPGAVANWAQQNGLKSSQSPPNLRDVVVPSQVVVQNDVSKIPHSCSSPAVVETLPQMDSVTVTRTKEMAIQYVNALEKTHTLPKSEPDVTTQPFPNPLRNSVEVAASCENNTVSQQKKRQESNLDVSSHSQKVVFLRSGYARAIASRNALEQAGSSKSSLSRLPGEELGSLRQPVPEKLRVNVSTPDVILLSDDEEELITCKLNEAAESSLSSFSGHEVQSSHPSRVAECSMDDGLGGQAYQAESKAQPSNNRCTSLSNDVTMHPACGGSSAEKVTLGDPSQRSFEAAPASGNRNQGATVMAVGSPVKERAAHTLSSSSNLEPMTERLDGLTASPSPVTEGVTVVQRGACNACPVPRVARVREKRDVELLEVGRLVVREGWHTRHAIYPAGKSIHSLT